MRRALSFGTVAEDYERYRPGYPDELVALVVGDARVERALEIGAGTGKATRVFARRGIAVTATDPDAGMLAVLARVCRDLPVTVLRAGLEDVPLDTRYDLVFAAAALHWTDAAGRWDRIAALLRPGGVVASFGGAFELADPEVAAVEDGIVRSVLPDGRGFPAPSPPVDGLHWPGNELAADDRFDDVRQVVLPREITLDRADYLGYLGTISAIRVLAAPDRDAVLERLDGALPERIALDAALTVHTARRR